MKRRFLCECYLQGSASHEIDLDLTKDCFDSCITFVDGKSVEMEVSEEKTSKWIKDVHILHKRHWKVLIS